MRNRIPEKVKRPHYVTIPKNAEKKYFYGKFDIVTQSLAVWTTKAVSNVVRCAKPFTLRVSVKGKEKILNSKVTS